MRQLEPPKICKETYHAYNLGIDRFSQNPPTRCDVVNNFIKRCPFDFFALEIGYRVHEIKSNTTLAQFPDEQFFLFR